MAPPAATAMPPCSAQRAGRLQRCTGRYVVTTPVTTAMARWEGQDSSTESSVESVRGSGAAMSAT